MPRARRKERTGGRTSSRKTRLCTRRCRRQSFSCEHCGTSNCSRFVAAAVESNVFLSNDGFSVHNYSTSFIHTLLIYIRFQQSITQAASNTSHQSPVTPMSISHRGLTRDHDGCSHSSTSWEAFRQPSSSSCATSRGKDDAPSPNCTTPGVP